MLDLRKDVFLRLVLAARKNESISKSIKNVHFDSWNNYSSKGLDDSIIFDNTVDKDSITQINKSVQSIRSERVKPRVNPAAAEKIDEKVEKIISDPMIAEIKMELEVAMQLIKKIKILDSKNPKIPILEQTVARLSSMLEQKIYV